MKREARVVQAGGEGESGKAARAGKSGRKGETGAIGVKKDLERRLNGTSGSAAIAGDRGKGSGSQTGASEIAGGKERSQHGATGAGRKGKGGSSNEARAIAGKKKKKAAKLRLKLIIDNTKQQLVYATCGRFTADVLLSFLTTPVGALVRRTGKSSGLGCMDSIYQSVQDMDARQFQSPSCRELLLRPRDAWGFSLSRLKIRINDDVGEAFYFCQNVPLCPVLGTFPGAPCVCGGKISPTKKYHRNPVDPKGDRLVFIRQGLSQFVVTDDLFIGPSSDAIKKKLCNRAGVDDPSSLQQRTLSIGYDQVLHLLKLSLVSNTPLTDAFLPSCFVRKNFQSRPEGFTTIMTSFTILFEQNVKAVRRKWNWITNGSKIEIFLLYNMKKDILMVKANRNFVDLLFSFLIFPFGSIAVALGDQSVSLGCIGNLHQVMRKLVYDGNTVGEGHNDMIDRNFLDPPISPHHHSQDVLLDIGNEPTISYCASCKICGKIGSPECTHGRPHVVMDYANPKFKEATTQKGGGYVRRPQTFFITENLQVKPVSDLGVLDPPSDIKEKKVKVGQKEALELLRASLISKNPITMTFQKCL